MPHSRRNLTMSEKALVQIIASSVEVYKKETFGLLLGKKHKRHYMVRDAINFQSARRGYESVDVPQIRVNRINYVLSHLTDFRVIGDFHSHPDYSSKLSPTDKADIRSGGMALSVLVVVRKAKRKAHRWEAKDKALRGFVGNRYHVEVIAFEHDRKKDRFFRIKIVCPYLRKLNRLEDMQKAGAK